MKYRELLQQLSSFDDEALDQDVTIYDRSIEEFYPAVRRIFRNSDFDFGMVSDALDEGHPFLMFRS